MTSSSPWPDSLPRTFEPFRVKTVEPIRLTTADERRRHLADAQHNLFRIPAEHVMIDLLTDSGTGAMSSLQWAGIMRGEEAYAGSASHQRLTEVVAKITGIGNVLPVHQGRVSERLLVEAAIGRMPMGNGMVVPNNAHFDTTRCMIEGSGAEAVDLLCQGGDDPANTDPFKGNIDLKTLERLLLERGEDVPFVMLTLTCNSNGGQPVSLANLRAARELCVRFGKPLFLDACRFAENAWFIRQREPGQQSRSVASIVREMFDCADGAAMSARKDGLSNVGGMLLIRDNDLYAKACRLCVHTQGFQMTYGTLPARDLEAIAVGMQETLEETYLSSRAAMIARLGERLKTAGVRIVEPVGGHAVWIDAEAFCPHLSGAEGPGHALACALYEHGGIRAVRIGSVMKKSATGGSRKSAEQTPMDLVRLAIPRRTYTQSHLDYVADVVIHLQRHASTMVRPMPQASHENAAARGRVLEPEFLQTA